MVTFGWTHGGRARRPENSGARPGLIRLVDAEGRARGQETGGEAVDDGLVNWWWSTGLTIALVAGAEARLSKAWTAEFFAADCRVHAGLELASCW